jgi:hypothetical protein
VFSEFGSLFPNKEDFPGPLSGAQKWKGAADTLNKYPIIIIWKAKLKD